VEELVTLLAGNLEAHETEVFSRDNGLLTFAADNGSPEFHGSPHSAFACSSLFDRSSHSAFRCYEFSVDDTRAGAARAKSTTARLSARRSAMGRNQPRFYLSSRKKK
jgi:hypothetical protein